MSNSRRDSEQLMLIAQRLRDSGTDGAALAQKVKAVIPALPEAVRREFEHAFGLLADSQMSSEQLADYFVELAKWMESRPSDPGMREF